MTKEPFKIFSYNEYTLGEIGICREPHTIAEFNNVKAWDADVIVTMTKVEEFGIEYQTICENIWLQEDDKMRPMNSLLTSI